MKSVHIHHAEAVVMLLYIVNICIQGWHEV